MHDKARSRRLIQNSVFLLEYGQFEHPGSGINHICINLCGGRSGVKGKLKDDPAAKMRRAKPGRRRAGDEAVKHCARGCATRQSFAGDGYAGSIVPYRPLPPFDPPGGQAGGGGTIQFAVTYPLVKKLLPPRPATESSSRIADLYGKEACPLMVIE